MRRKYFRSHQGNHWVFTGQTVNAKGEKRDPSDLLRIVNTDPAARAGQGDANPFDPKWSAYFAARHDRKQ